MGKFLTLAVDQFFLLGVFIEMETPTKEHDIAILLLIQFHDYGFTSALEYTSLVRLFMLYIVLASKINSLPFAASIIEVTDQVNSISHCAAGDGEEKFKYFR